MGHRRLHLPASLLVTVLVGSALAGCIGAPTGGSGGTAAVPDAPSYGHLSAPDADEVRSDGHVKIFAWSGSAPPAVGVPIFGAQSIEDLPEHAFEVDGSVGYVEVAATPGGAVDAFLLDGDGNVVCAATIPDDPTTCTAPADHLDATAEWSVQVTADDSTYDGIDYELEVSLHPPSHLPDPADLSEELSDELEYRISDTGIGGAGEPTIGLTSDGTIFVVEGHQVMRSTDDGETWEDVTPATSRISFDPMLRVDPWTDRVILDHLYVGCSYMWWSDDQGETWMHNPAACGTPANDHQKVAAGGHYADNPVYDGIIYYSYNSFSLLAGDDASVLVVSRSVDGGHTWTSTAAMSGARDFHYRTGGPVEADRDGNVYVPAYLEDGGIAVTASSDHGVTFDAVRAGELSGAGEGIDPGMAIDAAGNAYVAWWGPQAGDLDQARDGAGHAIWLAASTDQGDSWQDQVRVSPAGLESMVLVDAVAGDEGRVAVAYLATGETTRGPNRADGWADWHLYVSVTEDALAGNVTWHTTRVTPEDDPVQRGSICTQGVGCAGGNRNLLDFIDIQVGPDGRTYVAYTDGCFDGPCPTPAQSRDERGVVAIQESGPKLFVDGAPWAG